MKTQLVATLLYYKGTALYNKDGKLTSQHGTTKLAHGSHEWVNYLKRAAHLGISEIEVLNVKEINSQGEAEETHEKGTEQVLAVQEEVDTALRPTIEKPKTTEELRIEKLEAQIAILTENSKPAKKEAKKEAPAAIETKEPVGGKEESDDIEILRAEFTKVMGKKPHHMTSAKKLKKTIADNS